MVARVQTVAFQGIEAVPVDVQAQIAPGLVAFTIVGLPDKAVKEAGERVRAALVASGLSLPPKRITINLAPADLPKEGSHYDLPIALALMAAIGAFPVRCARWLSGARRTRPRRTAGADVDGVLPAAMAAHARELGIICPAASGPEAAWAGDDIDIVAPEIAAGAGQPSGRLSAVRAAGAEAARPRRGTARPERGARAGGGAPRARDRRRRWPQSPDDRAARRRQVDAGAAAALDPAAARSRANCSTCR